MTTTSFALRAPDCDLDDIKGCRTKLLDIVRGPQFETVLTDLAVTRASAATGPAPRGGEASIGAEAKSNGEWTVKAEVKITF